MCRWLYYVGSCGHNRWALYEKCTNEKCTKEEPNEIPIYTDADLYHPDMVSACHVYDSLTRCTGQFYTLNYLLHKSPLRPTTPEEKFVPFSDEVLDEMLEEMKKEKGT